MKDQNGKLYQVKYHLSVQIKWHVWYFIATYTTMAYFELKTKKYVELY